MNRFALLLVGLLCVGCGRQSASQSLQTSPTSTSSAGKAVRIEELFSAYETNEANADATYLNKTITFSALVEKVAKGADGKYFAGGYRFSNVREGPFNLVLHWSPAHVVELQSLKFSPDAHTGITAVGKCKGKMVSPGANPPFQIVFENCRIAK